MKITTNGHERELWCWHDLPADQQEWFDCVDGEDRYSQRFFKYQDCWYDTCQFMPAQGVFNQDGHKAGQQGWSGYQSDSFFSGTVIRWGEDFETVIAGRYVV